MILTRRERMYGMIAGLGVAIFALDYFLLEPYILGPSAEAGKQLAIRTAEQKTNDGIFSKEVALRTVWKKLQSDGLAANPSDAVATVRNAMNDWTRAEQVAFVNLKSDARDLFLNNDTFIERTLQFSGTGSQQSIARLLWRIESSSLPIRVNSIQVISRKEGTDDLSVQINMSTISPNPEAEKPAATSPKETR